MDLATPQFETDIDQGGDAAEALGNALGAQDDIGMVRRRGMPMSDGTSVLHDNGGLPSVLVNLIQTLF